MRRVPVRPLPIGNGRTDLEHEKSLIHSCGQLLITGLIRTPNSTRAVSWIDAV